MTDKMHNGYFVYTTDGGNEYIIRHGRAASGFEFDVIEQLHDGAIKLVRKFNGAVYKVTKYNGADAYTRACAKMESLNDIYAEG